MNDATKISYREAMREIMAIMDAWWTCTPLPGDRETLECLICIFKISERAIVENRTLAVTPEAQKEMLGE